MQFGFISLSFLPTKADIEWFNAYLLLTEQNRIHQGAMLLIIYLFWTNSQSIAEHSKDKVINL